MSTHSGNTACDTELQFSRIFFALFISFFLWILSLRQKTVFSNLPLISCNLEFRSWGSFGGFWKFGRFAFLWFIRRCLQWKYSIGNDSFESSIRRFWQTPLLLFAILKGCCVIGTPIHQHSKSNKPSKFTKSDANPQPVSMQLEADKKVTMWLCHGVKNWFEGTLTSSRATRRT
jgi:hypothetical protein